MQQPDVLYNKSVKQYEAPKPKTTASTDAGIGATMIGNTIYSMNMLSSSYTVRNSYQKK
ncbi:MAG: hypothetical protein ACLFTH_04925 [Candidatus Woesearchaeota archaeon]